MAASDTPLPVEHSHRAFRGTPDLHDYVPVESVEQEIQSLIDAVVRGDGIAVLTAAPGAGKTVACCHLQAELTGQFEAVLLSSSEFATRRSLLQAILFELGEAYEGLTEQELRLAILNHVRSGSSEGRGAVLIVDEAHLLNPRLLEELRCLTNHAADGESLIRIVLCGQLALEELLTSPALQALNYRITCHTTLEPLSMQESADLVAGRLCHVGHRVDAIFTPEALETICRVSDGNPRCLVQLCDHTLTLAAAPQETPIAAEVVRLALQDLKQLPLQWNESAMDQPAIETITSNHDNSDVDIADHDWPPILDEAHLEHLDPLEPEDLSGSEVDSCDVIEWTSDVPSLEVGADRDVAMASEPEPAAEGGRHCESQAACPDRQKRDQSLLTTVDGAVHTNRAMCKETEPAADASSVTAVGAFVETFVDDRYARLDQRTGRSVGLPETSQLITTLDSPSAVALESVASGKPSPGDVAGASALSTECLGTNEPSPPIRDDVFGNSFVEAAMVDEGRDSHEDGRDEAPVCVADADFDIVEPQWHEEPVTHDVPSCEPLPAIEIAQEEADVVPTVPHTPRIEAHRPYARLFSRLRRRERSSSSSLD